jgi:hypothetical protein
MCDQLEKFLIFLFQAEQLEQQKEDTDCVDTDLPQLPPKVKKVVGVVRYFDALLSAESKRDCLTRWIWLLMTCMVSFRHKVNK